MHLRLGAPDRRRIARGLADAPRRSELVTRILAMYLDMPGLTLRPEQSARVFGLPLAICTAVMNDLVRRGLLGRDPNGQYVKVA